MRTTEIRGEPSRGKTAWGWRVCWLLFASTVLNYMDRQAIAVVGERITEEFRIRFEDLGWVIAAFQLPYALFQVPAGFLADRWDVRRTYAVAVVWWSLAAIAVAWSPTLGALMAFRAILGIGESFNWPCALRVTATVLPRADRGLGNGIFNSGAAVGAVLTPLIVAPLTRLLGWRVAFAIIGAAGLVWVAVWIAVAYGPARALFAGEGRPVAKGTQVARPLRWAFLAVVAVAIIGGVVGARVETNSRLDLPGPPGARVAWNVAEGAVVHKGDPIAELESQGVMSRFNAPFDATIVALDPAAPGLTTRSRLLGLSAYWLAIAFLMMGLLVVARVAPLGDLGTEGWAAGLGEVTRSRRFWVLVIVSVSVNVCWHFLVNWLPTYLKTDRGMAFVTGSLLSALPFLAADVGNLGGGAASRWLTGRGMSTPRARGTVVTVCVLLIAAGAGVGSIHNDVLILVLLGLMAMGTAGFMANYFAYCQDVSPSRTGLVVGILGGLGNLFAAGFAPIAGRIKDTSGGFGPVFLIVGLLPFVGLAALWIGWGRDRDD